MSDVPRGFDPAAIAGQLAQLREQLAKAQSDLEAERQTSAADRAASGKKVQDLETQAKALESTNDALQNQVKELTDRITVAGQDSAALRTTRQDLQEQTGIANKAVADLTVAQGRVKELESLFLSPPPTGMGIDQVQMFRTSDGTTHKTLSDATVHIAMLALTDQGYSEQEARRLISLRDKLRPVFDMVDKNG